MRKICQDYSHQAKYQEEKHPKFYSNSNDFVLTLYNLNYGVANEENNRGSQIAPNCPKLPQTSPNFPKLPQTSPNFPEHLMGFMRILRKFPGATLGQLAKEADVTDRTVKTYIQTLKELGLIKRVGTNRKGYWEIIK